MKCLSIQQPYATGIVRGLRSYESRTWRTGYTGPLLIHAGKQNYEGSETVMHGGQKWLVSAYRDVGIPHPIAHGAIVGVVWLDGMGADLWCDAWEERKGSLFGTDNAGVQTVWIIERR